MLTPLDIHNKEFKRSFRGYNEDEIDGFLDQVVTDYEQLYQQGIEQKETIERLSSKLENYQNMENTLHSTLIVAQQTAEEVKLNAKKSAELLIKEAEVRAQQVADEATNKVRIIKGEYQEINKQLQIYRTRMKTMLQAQLEIVAKAAEEDDS